MYARVSCRKANLSPAAFMSRSSIATAAMLAAKLLPVLASCFSVVDCVACICSEGRITIGPARASEVDKSSALCYVGCPLHSRDKEIIWDI